MRHARATCPMHMHMHMHMYMSCACTCHMHMCMHMHMHMSCACTCTCACDMCMCMCMWNLECGNWDVLLRRGGGGATAYPCACTQAPKERDIYVETRRARGAGETRTSRTSATWARYHPPSGGGGTGGYPGYLQRASDAFCARIQSTGPRPRAARCRATCPSRPKMAKGSASLRVGTSSTSSRPAWQRSARRR